MANPQINFAVDAERLVGLNSQMGLLSQKMETISRVSTSIFRNDPFANMTTQATRASGALSAVLANLRKIAETQAQISGMGALGTSASAARPVVMGGAVSVGGGSVTMTGAANFIPQQFTPGFRNQPAWGIDPKYGRGDFDRQTRATMGETIRQFAIGQADIRTLAVQGMGPRAFSQASSTLDNLEALATSTMPEGSARTLMLKRIGLTRAYAANKLDVYQLRQVTQQRMSARETWNQNNTSIKGYISQLQGGSLTDSQDAELQALMSAQQQALINNQLGFGRARMRNALNVYQGFKRSIGGAPGDLQDRIFAYANRYEQQLDRGILTGQRNIFRAGIGELRSSVDDFFAGTRGQRLADADRDVARQLREELSSRRADLAARRDSGNLMGTGFDSTSIRSVIKGLDSEVSKLDRALRASNQSVNTLTGGFMRLAGAIVGIQSLRDVFMNATQQAVQFDRTLGQIQARALRMTDPQTRAGFTSSVVNAALADAVRTGMPIQQIAQVQETVHLAANGTFQQKAALGATINNLALTTDIPASEYLGVIAPMSKAGFQATDMRDFLERSALFQARYGVDKSRMNAFFTSFASGINALGPLGDLDTIEAMARQEAAGARDRVFGSKLNRIQTNFNSARTRTRLLEILGRGGQRGDIGGVGIDQILNTGSAVLSMDMLSKAYKQGNISQKELLAVAQTVDQRSGNQTYAMLTKGLDGYRSEIAADRAAVAIGAGSSDRAASLATQTIGGTMDRMTNAITALTVQGISPLGAALKGLMNVVNALSVGMSKLPGVTEAVVSALGVLATGLLVQKGADMVGGWMKNMKEGGGFSGLVGGVGKAGIIGSAIATTMAVGGWWYDRENKKSLQENEDGYRRAAANLPGQLKTENAATEALTLLNQIQEAEAKRLDTTGMRHDLELKVGEALKGQKGAEEALLDLKKAQTSEMREQLAIKKLLEISGEARGKRERALQIGEFAQRVIANDERGSIWNDEKRMKTFFVGESRQNIDEVYQGVLDIYPAATSSKLSALLKKHDGDKASALYEFFANKTAFGSSDSNIRPLEDYGVKVSYGGFWTGASQVDMQAQLQRIRQERRAVPVSGALERLHAQEVLAGRDKTGNTPYLNTTDFMRVVDLGGEALGVSALTAPSLTGYFSSLSLNTRKSLKKKAEVNLNQFVQQAYTLAGQGGAVGTWAQTQSNGKQVTPEMMQGWLVDASSKPVFRAQMPGSLQRIADRVGVLQTMLGLDTDDHKAVPERGRGSGGGGSINWLSVLEKYFSSVDRAAGVGDYTGLAQISGKFSDLTTRFLGREGTPVELVDELYNLSVTDAHKAFTSAKHNLDVSGVQITDPEAYRRQLSLLEDKREQELLNYQGYRMMFTERLSPEGKRKTTRKVVDEALKQHEDNIAYGAYAAAYDGLDVASATDLDMANAQVVMKGRIAAGKRSWLAKQRVEVVRGEFADKDAQLDHIDRLSREQLREEMSARRTLARNVVATTGQYWDTQASTGKAWMIAADMIGDETSRRRAQVQAIGMEQEALQKRLDLAEKLKLSEEERLDLAVKIKNLDIERLKASEEMTTTLRLKQVGEDMTRQTLSTLFMGDPATRNKSLTDMWTRLPMQGVTDSLTRTLVGMGADNPIGEMARFMFDPGGEMTYKENIAKLNASIVNLITATNNLADAYLASSGRANMAYQSMGIPGTHGGSALFPNVYNGTLDTSLPSRFNYTWNPKSGTFEQRLASSTGTPSGGTSVSEFALDYSQFKLQDNLGLTNNYGSLDFTGYTLGSGAGIVAAGLGGGGNVEGEDTASGRAATAIASNAGNMLFNTRAGVLNTFATGVSAMGGSNFWSPGEKGTRGVKLNTDGSKSLTGAGWGVAGAQVAMSAYSGYTAGKASGSQAAANWGAAGGALGAGASAAFIAFGVSNPVGWVMLAGAALAQIMAGTEAAAKAAEEKTKAYKKQEDDFQRQVAINEEQRKQLGLSADRVLSERADVDNAFTGVAASAFLSGRFAANAMQVNVQNLQVVANSPQELSAALAGAFTQQVGRGI